MERRELAVVVSVATALGTLAVLSRGRRVQPGGRGGPGPPPTGVREPRRPLQPAGKGVVAVDPTDPGSA